MSNKNLLNESTIRKFMKLANMEPLAEEFVSTHLQTEDEEVELEEGTEEEETLEEVEDETIDEMGGDYMGKDDDEPMDDLGGEEPMDDMSLWMISVEKRRWAETLKFLLMKKKSQHLKQHSKQHNL